MDIFSLKVYIILFMFIGFCGLVSISYRTLTEKMRKKYHPEESYLRFSLRNIYDPDVMKMRFFLKPIENGWRLAIWLDRITFIYLIIFIIVCLSFGIN